MERLHILGLDIGSSQVRAAQGVVDPESQKISIVATVTGASSGLRRGVILDHEEVVSSVSAVLEQMARITGAEPRLASVNIGGSHLNSVMSRGAVAVARPDGVVTEADVSRVMESSRAVSFPANKEILHALPKSFILDGQAGIPDPRGSSGIRLEVETCLVYSASSNLRMTQKLAAQTGLPSPVLVASPLAASESVLSARQKELGVMVLDIGAGTTGVSIYEEGGLLHLAVIPIGSGHITNDLAIGLRCSIDTAERVKRLHGKASWDEGERNDIIDLSKINPEESGRVEKREIVRIIEARIAEIFEYVRAELKKCGRTNQLPAGVVLVGGGSALSGIVPITKRLLELPASIGDLDAVESIIGQIKDPAFAVAVGLVHYATKQGLPKQERFKKIWDQKGVAQWRKWMQSLLP